MHNCVFLIRIRCRHFFFRLFNVYLLRIYFIYICIFFLVDLFVTDNNVMVCNLFLFFTYYYCHPLVYKVNVLLLSKYFVHTRERGSSPEVV